MRIQSTLPPEAELPFTRVLRISAKKRSQIGRNHEAYFKELYRAEPRQALIADFNREHYFSNLLIKDFNKTPDENKHTACQLALAIPDKKIREFILTMGGQTLQRPIIELLQCIGYHHNQDQNTRPGLLYWPNPMLKHTQFIPEGNCVIHEAKMSWYIVRDEKTDRYALPVGQNEWRGIDDEDISTLVNVVNSHTTIESKHEYLQQLYSLKQAFKAAKTSYEQYNIAMQIAALEKNPQIVKDSVQYAQLKKQLFEAVKYKRLLEKHQANKKQGNNIADLESKIQHANNKIRHLQNDLEDIAIRYDDIACQTRHNEAIQLEQIGYQPLLEVSLRARIFRDDQGVLHYDLEELDYHLHAKNLVVDPNFAERNKRQRCREPGVNDKSEAALAQQDQEIHIKYREMIAKSVKKANRHDNKHKQRQQSRENSCKYQACSPEAKEFILHTQKAIAADESAAICEASIERRNLQRTAKVAPDAESSKQPKLGWWHRAVLALSKILSRFISWLMRKPQTQMVIDIQPTLSHYEKAEEKKIMNRAFQRIPTVAYPRITHSNSPTPPISPQTSPTPQLRNISF